MAGSMITFSIGGYWVLAIIASTAPVRSGAQTPSDQRKADSLLRIYNNTRSDTMRLQVLSELGCTCINYDVKDALKYSLEALVLAEKLGRRNKVAELNLDISSHYRRTGELSNSIRYAMVAMDEAQMAGDTSSWINAHKNMGLLYGRVKEGERALKEFMTGLELARIHGVEIHIAILESNVGTQLSAQGRYMEALPYMRSALARSIANGFHGTVFNMYHRLSELYLETAALDSAIYYAEKARGVTEALNEAPEYRLNLLSHLGHLYNVMARSDKRFNDSALFYLRAGLELAKERNMADARINGWQLLSDVHERQGETLLALKALQTSLHLRDSLEHLGRTRQIDAMVEERQEHDRQNLMAAKEAEVWQARRHIWYISLGAGALVLLLTVILMSLRRTRAERRRSDQLLHNILPAHTAAELKATGITEPRHHDNVTILFTDFKDFTKVVGGLSARETVKVIDHYFRAFDRIVKKHGLEKIKTIGDAYMCVSGIPDEKPDHALRAVRAAKEMLAFVKEEEQIRSATGAPWFRIRIGLHTGPVVAGVVGESKFAYDVWGDTVNTAARLEQHGEADRINISRTTFEYVKHRFPCTSKGCITVKHGVELELFQVEEVGELVV